MLEEQVEQRLPPGDPHREKQVRVRLLEALLHKRPRQQRQRGPIRPRHDLCGQVGLEKHRRVLRIGKHGFKIAIIRVC